MRRATEFHCPNCGYKLNLIDYSRFLGRIGGRKASGAKKRRTPEQARKAALARWAKRKAKGV